MTQYGSNYGNPNPYYPQYQQPQQMRFNPMQQSYVQSGLKGRPVSSIEEVVASSIDFDGSVSYFPDMAHRKIYTKQINLDGTSSVLTYVLEEPKVMQQNSFVTREEYNKLLQEFTLLKEEIQNGLSQRTNDTANVSANDF